MDHIVFFLQAIVFRPFKGEVLDAVVTQVNKVEHKMLPVKKSYQVFLC